MMSRTGSNNRDRIAAWWRTGGGASGCAVAGVSSGNTPISTDLAGGLPGGGETIAILAIVGLLVAVGRWAFRHVAHQPALAHDVNPVTASDSDELWHEFDRQDHPTGV